MDDMTMSVMLRLGLAVLIGGVIGLDRAYRGRPAGFRTHILVCLASSLLMVLMEFQWAIISPDFLSSVRVDPTRMAQGIMTGIGFLGAGVIMQDKQVVRGLTTAASIWITSAIGIIVGAGFYSAALLATALTILTLVGLNNFTRILPIRHYARLVICFKRHESLTEQDVKSMLVKHDLVLGSFAYKLTDDGNRLSYEMMIYTSEPEKFTEIAQSLLAIDVLLDFSLRPLGD
jgi:putative Mg2+ transporter-C (MgtC) family protein